MKLTQNVTGRAFEYGLLIYLAENLPAKIEINDQLNVIKQSFELCPPIEKQRIQQAAEHVFNFIWSEDNNFRIGPLVIKTQSDQSGAIGDVRDILITNSKTGQTWGISAKNRHYAIKHSRLSRTINFGQDWFGVPVSKQYFDTVTPIFDHLRELQEKGLKWRDLNNKADRFYVPILNAFLQEISQLATREPSKVPSGMVKYLVGQHDYYKVIKENGNVSIWSFNMDNTLGWGRKIQLPDELINISFKPRSKTTLIATFNHGWQISFRIHNASTLVEPSLKFDIQPVGYPSTMSRHTIHYHR